MAEAKAQQEGFKEVSKKSSGGWEGVSEQMTIALEVMDYTDNNIANPQLAKNVYLGAMISVMEMTIAESHLD